MPQPITKAHLDGAVKAIKSDIQDLTRHFNESQALQNNHLDKMDTRLEKMQEELHAVAEDVSKIKLVVIDLMAIDRYLRNLVKQLKSQGIKLDEQKIFAT